MSQDLIRCSTKLGYLGLQQMEPNYTHIAKLKARVLASKTISITIFLESIFHYDHIFFIAFTVYPEY